MGFACRGMSFAADRAGREAIEVRSHMIQNLLNARSVYQVSPGEGFTLKLLKKVLAFGLFGL